MTSTWDAQQDYRVGSTRRLQHRGSMIVVVGKSRSGCEWWWQCDMFAGGDGRWHINRARYRRSSGLDGRMSMSKAFYKEKTYG